MNSRSEQRASNYVRSSIAFHLSCIAFVCYACLYLLFLPPLLLSGSPDERCRCPCDRLRRRRPYPYYRATRQAEPFPSPTYRLLVYTLSAALGICCCYVTFLFKCIACHCRHLLYLFLYPIAAYIIYIIYSAVDPALC